jgi:hypothetical protein
MSSIRVARRVGLATIAVVLGALIFALAAPEAVSAEEEQVCCLQLVCTEFGDGCYGTPCVCGLSCCAAGSPTACRA